MNNFIERLDRLEKPKRRIEQNLKSEITDNPAVMIMPKKEGVSRDFLKKVLTLHEELINEAKLRNLNLSPEFIDSDENKRTRSVLEKELITLVEKRYAENSRKEKSDLIQCVLNETLGLGPLEDLIQDDSINEIMVNSANLVFIERQGIIEETPVIFYDNDHVKHVIQRIVSQVGRRIDESSPMVDARLKDGSRVNAIIPPVALTGPTLTIRKFRDKGFTSKDLLRFGSLSPEMEEFLRLSVLSRMNILVSGGTGSGKTTLLNALSAFIPAQERIITIEDSAELRLKQKHTITLESRPSNIESSGEIKIRDLVRNALRMRPDRLIVGEVRSGEALDMLQAMNTGHDGSMTTAHANNPQDSILRLETMVLMSGFELPIRAIRQQISSAFDLIVQISRLQDGSRKIVSITELSGMENDQVLFKEIYGYRQTGFDEKNKKVDGAFYSTKLVPTCVKKMQERGLSVPMHLFS